MAKKPKIRSHISEASDALRDVMVEGLTEIASNMVQQIASKAARLPDSQLLDAIKEVDRKGIAAYKTKLLDAMAVISKAALDQARKEVPKAKSVKLAGEDEGSIELGEFESLPAKIRRKVLAKSQLLIDSQIADLEKAVFFQFVSNHDATDSMSELIGEMDDASLNYIEGATVTSGAAATAADLVNSARNAFFLDDDVGEQIDAFVFTNGDPVSEICSDLAGTVFSKDDPDLNTYWPPLHWNCKSYILPILQGNLGNRKVETLDDQVSKAGRQSIQFSESCGCRAHGEKFPFAKTGEV